MFGKEGLASDGVGKGLKLWLATISFRQKQLHVQRLVTCLLSRIPKHWYMVYACPQSGPGSAIDRVKWRSVGGSKRDCGSRTCEIHDVEHIG